MITRRPLTSVVSVNLMGGSFDGEFWPKASPVAATRIARIGFKETSLSLLQYIRNYRSRTKIRRAAGTRSIRLRFVHSSEARTWSFYILLVTFMGISPGGARESSPWREPWEQTRTARSPVGAKEPFHGDSPIAGHEGPSYAPTGLARLWAGPTGLTPWALF